MLQDFTFSKVSKQVVMSFCLAGVALGILTKVVLCDRRNAILLQDFQKMIYIFRGRRSTLAVSIVILRDIRSASGMLCCVFFCE